MQKKADDKKLLGLTVRIPEADSRVFQALLSLNGDTANELLKKTIMDYIKKHKHLLNMDAIQKDSQDK